MQNFAELYSTKIKNEEMKKREKEGKTFFVLTNIFILIKWSTNRSSQLNLPLNLSILSKKKTLVSVISKSVIICLTD